MTAWKGQQADGAMRPRKRWCMWGIYTHFANIRHHRHHKYQQAHLAQAAVGTLAACGGNVSSSARLPPTRKGSTAKRSPGLAIAP
jgi:hypothetical protein